MLVTLSSGDIELLLLMIEHCLTTMSFHDPRRPQVLMLRDKLERWRDEQ